MKLRPRQGWLIAVMLGAFLTACETTDTTHSDSASGDPTTSPIVILDPDDSPSETRSSEGIQVSSECPENTLQEFDWPPPAPSSYVAVPRTLVFAEPSGNERLGDVSEILESALIDLGFRQFGYMSVGCDGFALITQMERIRRDGSSSSARRFDLPNSANSQGFNLASFIKQLIGARPGFYRQVVFVSTSRTINSDQFQTSPDGPFKPPANDTSLPIFLRGQDLSPEHSLFALVYEFQLDEGGEEARQLSPSRLDAQRHLDQMGIYEELTRRSE